MKQPFIRKGSVSSMYDIMPEELGRSVHYSSGAREYIFEGGRGRGGGGPMKIS